MINQSINQSINHADYVGQRLFVKQFVRLLTTFKLLNSRIFYIQNDNFAIVRKAVA